jgi:hypothetical protein
MQVFHNGRRRRSSGTSNSSTAAGRGRRRSSTTPLVTVGEISAAIEDVVTDDGAAVTVDSVTLRKVRGMFGFVVSDSITS